MNAQEMPKANSQLLVEIIESETVAYHQVTRQIHRLEPAASKVFSLCDGNTLRSEAAIVPVNQKRRRRRQFGGGFPCATMRPPLCSIDAHKIPCYPIIARSVSKWERLAALLRGHGGICAASPIIFRAGACTSSF